MGLVVRNNVERCGPEGIFLNGESMGSQAIDRLMEELKFVSASASVRSSPFTYLR